MLNITRKLSSKWRWLSVGLLLFLAACSTGQAQVTQESAEVAQTATEIPEETVQESTEIPDTPVPEPTQTEVVEREPAEKYADFTIITLLPRDAIPAIDNPEFLSTAEADEFYDPDELIIGVEFEGDARAYSVPFLSNHEIVNDTVGGRKIAVTW